MPSERCSRRGEGPWQICRIECEIIDLNDLQYFQATVKLLWTCPCWLPLAVSSLTVPLATTPPCQGEAEGILALAQPWPSTLRTVYGDHERYQSNYFAPFPGYYFTGGRRGREQSTAAGSRAGRAGASEACRRASGGR